MLAIGIHGDDHLIVLLEDVPEPCSEGNPLPKIRSVFQKNGSVFQSHLFRLVHRTIIHND
jgi:hypothetical protein